MISNRFCIQSLFQRYHAEQSESALTIWRPLIYRVLLVVVLALLCGTVVQASDKQANSSTTNNIETVATAPVSIADPATELMKGRDDASSPAIKNTDASVLAKSKAEQRLEQIASLQQEIDLGTRTAADADALYEELSRQLRIERKRLEQALRWARSPTDTLPPESSAEKDTSATE